MAWHCIDHELDVRTDNLADQVFSSSVHDGSTMSKCMNAKPPIKAAHNWK